MELNNQLIKIFNQVFLFNFFNIFLKEAIILEIVISKGLELIKKK